VYAWFAQHPAAFVTGKTSNMNLMAETFLSIPFLFWGIVCLLVAGVFAVAWPRNKVVLANRTRYIILRWGHSLVWVFLALSCFIRIPGNSGLADLVAFLALPTYMIFLVTLTQKERAIE
jgi:hypothetical protein